MGDKQTIRTIKLKTGTLAASANILFKLREFSKDKTGFRLDIKRGAGAGATSFDVYGIDSNGDEFPINTAVVFTASATYKYEYHAGNIKVVLTNLTGVNIVVKCCAYNEGDEDTTDYIANDTFIVVT